MTKYENELKIVYVYNSKNEEETQQIEVFEKFINRATIEFLDCRHMDDNKRDFLHKYLIMETPIIAFLYDDKLLNKIDGMQSYKSIEFFFNRINIKYRLKKLGKDTIIYEYAKIARPEVVEIGDHCKIDDFTFIYGGEGVKIGSYTHIASFSSIFGGGSIEMGEYVGISQRVGLITGTNDYKLRMHMTAAAPPDEQGYYHSHIIIEDEVIIFNDCSILAPEGKPLIIGEGAVIGANSFVKEDVEPWSIVAGTPARKIGMRPKLLDWIQKNKEERRKNEFRTKF